MEIVRYERWKLWVGTAMWAFLGLWALFFFLHPQFTSRMLLGHLIFGTGLGHYLLAPVILGACLLYVCSTIRAALGDCVAIRTEGSDLVVKTLFRTVRLPLHYLAPVAAKQSRYGSNVVYTLIFRSPMGGLSGATTVRLPLPLTDARNDPHAVMAAIEKLRSGSGGSARHDRATFDPHLRASFGRKVA